MTRPVTIDNNGGSWAWHLGGAMRWRYPAGAEGRKACPFREGTPHRQFWWAGWTSQNPQPLFDRIEQGEWS